jgi:hypothetical protein
LEKAEKQRVKMQKAVDDVSLVYEVERDKANVVATKRTNTIREIYKTAPSVPVDCSAPDAARRLLESSVSDANAAAAAGDQKLAAACFYQLSARYHRVRPLCVCVCV